MLSKIISIFLISSFSLSCTKKTEQTEPEELKNITVYKTYPSINQQIQKNADSTVLIDAFYKSKEVYNGTGVIIVKDNEQWILSAAHLFEKESIEVVEENKTKVVLISIDNPIQIKVTKYLQSNGKQYIVESTAKLINYSRKNDLALLKINNKIPLDNIGVSFDLNYEPTIGESIYHIGNHLGIYTDTYTKGYISHNKRKTDTSNETNLIQMNIFCLQGSSGGGVFKESNNKCIGIISSIGYIKDKEKITILPNLSFSVDIYHVKQWLEEIDAYWIIDQDSPKKEVKLIKN